VKLHANAKTTPKSRQLLVERILEGWDPGSAAEAVGVSRRTGMKWLARYRAEGLRGLQDRPSTPHRIPHRTCQARIRRIKALRWQRLAAHQIARLLGMARSTVSAVLVRLGLSRLKVLEPKEPANSYERARPGELVHLDVKKLGKIKRIGKRIHGDRAVRSRGAGWEYVHVCIDDHSRVSYVEVLQDERAVTAAAFLRRAVAWYADLGVRVERALTDNGSCYVSGDFREACLQLGVTPKRTRPYRPRTNGKAERLIQTLLREWAYAKPYRTSAWRLRALHPWLNHYNQVRPHGSLDGLAPMTRIIGSG
jgi:transposase InsO family protein